MMFTKETTTFIEHKLRDLHVPVSPSPRGSPALYVTRYDRGMLKCPDMTNLIAIEEIFEKVTRNHIVEST